MECADEVCETLLVCHEKTTTQTEGRKVYALALQIACGSLLSLSHSCGRVSGMSECGHRAVLLVTTTPSGTTTSLVRQRIDLRCKLELGHDGEHSDPQHGEHWVSMGERMPTLLRDEHEDNQ